MGAMYMIEAADGTVGCGYKSSFARWFCRTYGCNSDRPEDWCWLPVFCGDDRYICNGYKVHCLYQQKIENVYFIISAHDGF